MERRSFLNTLGMAGAAAVASQPMMKAFGQPNHPNVLFIFIEDMNDWVGAMGHPDAITPNLDAFANSGVMFSNAHCSGPSCNPSRTAMFTGLNCSTSGIYYNGEDWRQALPNAYSTMPDHFLGSGYYNIGIGKYYHPPYLDDEPWNEVYRGLPNPHLMNGGDPYLPYHPWPGQQQQLSDDTDFLWGANDSQSNSYQDAARVAFANEKLASVLPQPFFMAVGTRATHYPAVPPRRFTEMYNPGEIELPPYFPGDLADIPQAGLDLIQNGLFDSILEHKNWRKAVQTYLGSISFVDDSVGQILTALDQSGYADDTVVVISSDHGFHLGEKRHWRKWTLWEESTKVPFMIRAPGITTPGGVCNEAVSILDLFPTFVDLCNLEPQPYLEGVSLRPQLENPATPKETPALTTHGAGNHAIRDERWRYIRYANQTEELYDHDVDPNEWTNLADDPQYADIKAELGAWMPDDINAPRKIWE